MITRSSTTGTPRRRGGRTCRPSPGGPSESRPGSPRTGCTSTWATSTRTRSPPTRSTLRCSASRTRPRSWSTSEPRQAPTAGEAPATIRVLSGDVHHSYVAHARLGPVYQVVCSPVHNQLPWPMRPLVRLAWSRGAAVSMGLLARLAGTVAPGIRWDLVAGPFIGNAIGTLVHHGRSGYALIEGTDARGELHRLARLDLPDGNGSGAPATPARR